MTTNHGNVNHVEIPVTDIKKAKSFFDQVFGWNTDIEMMGPNYGIFDSKGTASIGFPVVDKIPEHGINIVFYADDINATLQTIEKAGGKIFKEKYQIAPEIGYAAEFLDCFGNRLGLFSRE
ncbi:MAG: VOC family protein [Candidatus Kariarchaeaceae archaeon]|jgi:predicted enzyme related to lactoylglutathione lyase